MKILSNIDFRRQVAMSYILRFGNESKASGRKSQVPAENDMRFDNVGHIIQPIPSKNVEDVKVTCVNQLYQLNV